MDQLEVNLSELRVALIDRQRAKGSHLTLDAPLLNDGDADDTPMVFEVSTDQSALASIEPKPARSWFQRLFGV